MIKIDVYMTTIGLVAFNSGEKVTVTPYQGTDDVHLSIGIEDVIISDATENSFDIQKHSKYVGPITR